MTATARTGLVTGANSGLGFEAAAQLAEEGYGRVVVTARTAEKAKRAVALLRDRTGRDVFEYVTLDNGKLTTVEQAADDLVSRGFTIDTLLLNAGIAPTNDVVKTDEGIEMTTAASLTGHHVLTMRLLENGLLSDTARIVISGSEAARGDVPTFSPVPIDEFASEHFGGNVARAIEAQMRMDSPASYKPSDTYATTKLFVAWWAAELARKLPEGMTVNAVSPGSTPDTNAVANAPFYMRRIMIPIFKLIPGMSHTVRDGARRYIDIAARGPEVTGKFFASKPKKMTGPLEEITMDQFDNPEGQRALWDVTSQLVGVGYPD